MNVPIMQTPDEKIRKIREAPCQPNAGSKNKLTATHLKSLKVQRRPKSHCTDPCQGWTDSNGKKILKFVLAAREGKDFTPTRNFKFSEQAIYNTKEKKSSDLSPHFREPRKLWHISSTAAMTRHAQQDRYVSWKDTWSRNAKKVFHSDWAHKTVHVQLASLLGGHRKPPSLQAPFRLQTGAEAVDGLKGKKVHPGHQHHLLCILPRWSVEGDLASDGLAAHVAHPQPLGADGARCVATQEGHVSAALQADAAPSRFLQLL